MSPDGGVVCWVRDNGQGMAPERLDRILEPLESDSQKTEGSDTGLGLAIVKTFVEAHDGQVTVESTAGAGSKFSFTLPTRRARG